MMKSFVVSYLIYLRSVDLFLIKFTWILQNLLELIESNEEYSKFAELIKEVNMTDLLANANRSLTILIPKNDIFAEVKDYFDELRKEENHKSLEDVIKAHIIDGRLIASPFLVRPTEDIDNQIISFISHFQTFSAAPASSNPIGPSCV